MVVCLLVTSDLCFVFSVSDNNSVVVEGPKEVHKAALYANDGQEASDGEETRNQDQRVQSKQCMYYILPVQSKHCMYFILPVQSKQCMYYILPIGLKWQSLSLDYRFVMLI